MADAPMTIEARLDALEAAVKGLEAAVSDMPVPEAFVELQRSVKALQAVKPVAADPKMASDLAEVVDWMKNSHGVGGR